MFGAEALTSYFGQGNTLAMVVYVVVMLHVGQDHFEQLQYLFL